jgi:hypothetical protein
LFPAAFCLARAWGVVAVSESVIGVARATVVRGLALFSARMTRSVLSTVDFPHLTQSQEGKGVDELKGI